MVAALIVLFASGLQGDLWPWRAADIYAPDTGFVSRILVDPGSSVAEGDLLAVLFADHDKQIEVRAPFAGTITRVNVQTGVRVGPGTRRHQHPVFEIEDTTRLRLMVAVPRDIPVGTRVRFQGGEGVLERIVERVGVRFAEIAVENRDGRLKSAARVEVFLK